jgi:hypothetical protein
LFSTLVLDCASLGTSGTLNQGEQQQKVLVQHCLTHPPIVVARLCHGSSCGEHNARVELRFNSVVAPDVCRLVHGSLQAARKDHSTNRITAMKSTSQAPSAPCFRHPAAPRRRVVALHSNRQVTTSTGRVAVQVHNRQPRKAHIVIVGNGSADAPKYGHALVGDKRFILTSLETRLISFQPRHGQNPSIGSDGISALAAMFNPW